MKPSVGRIVHYRVGSECWAALVTAVDTGEWTDQDTNVTTIRESVCLNVMPPMREIYQRQALEGDSSGTWHWPERVE